MSRTWRFNSAPHLTWHGSQRPVVCTHYLYVINLFIKTTSGYLSIPGFEPRPTACGEENSSTTDLAWFPGPAMLHDLIQGARGPGYNWSSNHGGSKINEFVLGLLSVLNKIKLKYELRYIRTISQNSWFVYILVSFHCWKFVFCLELMSELIAINSSKLSWFKGDYFFIFQMIQRTYTLSIPTYIPKYQLGLHEMNNFHDKKSIVQEIQQSAPYTCQKY